MDKARIKYMECLADSSGQKIQQFESPYLQLREYLDSSTVEKSNDESEQMIETRCRYMCLAKIKDVISVSQLNKICIAPPLPPNKYLAFLIDTVVTNAMSSELGKFSGFYEAFAAYNELHFQMPNVLHSYLTDFGKQDRNFRIEDTMGAFAAMGSIFEALFRIDDVLIAFWNFYYKNNDTIPALTKDTYTSHAELIAERLSNDASEAEKYFGKILKTPISHAVIQKAITSHRDKAKCLNPGVLWEHFQAWMEQIYYAILLITLHHVVQDIKPILSTCISPFIDMLKDNNSTNRL